VKLARFLFLIDRYGPDRDAWPVRDRARAERLLTDSVIANQAMGESERLDELLRTLTIDVEDDALARVMACVPDIVRRRRNRLEVTLEAWGLLPLWPRLGFLAAALVLGLIVGFTQSARVDLRSPGGALMSGLLSLADPIQELGR
jgi:hypothetical protein